MFRRPDFQNAGAQQLKVGSFVRVGAPKHNEPFKHLHECFCEASSFACICKHGLALETNPPDRLLLLLCWGVLDLSARDSMTR